MLTLSPPCLPAGSGMEDEVRLFILSTFPGGCLTGFHGLDMVPPLGVDDGMLGPQVLGMV